MTSVTLKPSDGSNLSRPWGRNGEGEGLKGWGWLKVGWNWHLIYYHGDKYKFYKFINFINLWNVFKCF